jgi:ATP-dependent DNA ligase
VVGAPGAVGELRAVGVAPLHVDRETRGVVMALVDELRTDSFPILAPRRRRPVTWVGDGLVAEVRYLERTPTGLLRHASAQRVQAGGGLQPTSSGRLSSGPPGQEGS